jgi:hypothetical protein
MKAEQEKISAKVRAVSMHLNGGKLQLPAEEESCYVVLVAESGCTLQYAEQTMLLNPGSALLLGPGGGCIQQTGSAAPELVGCSFPLSALHELRTQTQRDFSRLFEPEQSAVLYGSVQWNSREKSRWVWVRSSCRALSGKLQPTSSGAALPVCWMQPPPGPSSSALPGLSSMVCSAYCRVQPLSATSTT